MIYSVLMVFVVRIKYILYCLKYYLKNKKSPLINKEAYITLINKN